MARGVNKVTLIGNLGADPENRFTASGMAITNLRIATTRSWMNKQTNERQEETEWHRVVLFGRTAEVAAEYLRKGSQVYIEGRIQTKKWQDQQGQDRWSTEVVGEDMQLLGGRSGGSTAPYDSGGQQQRPQQSQPQQPQQQNQNQNQGGGQSAPPMDGDFEDDVPF